ncbi:exportin-5-like [Acipenser oxyrinchus oxyrinchus]|uniref:Exportin-5 n=1 Tax=Acipenser oxyrinchus oxyrinchus TaxID=40147 RepID=A0AAD8GB27_ACIOX|nr:exportin-5-like [Acipenser oxyrinchus oxyrinchus]
MSEQVNALCDQLIKAVNVMMDTESSQRYRLEALKFCEEFKEKCLICVPCGLKLAEKTQPPVIRHFGLQILEHCVKFRWNNMPQQEKVHLKNNVMGLISNDIRPILEEESHIKDVLSRIVVEMIKREWPQHWPDMLKELESLMKQGEAQTELVMFILLRLAEDVVTFQTLPTQRRHDIQQTLAQNMENVFNFLINILQQSVNKYRKMKTDPAQEIKARAHCRVGVAALNTLAGYIDWVALVHITHDNCRLLEMLCLLLSEAELQLEAVECLLIAVSRKGKLEDRKPLMILFGDVAMHYILSAAQPADGAGLTERHYVFLKRLCQVLCALGSQLCALLASDVDVETPANLGKYLEAFLAFTTHPSQFLRSSTQVIWGSLFRHKILSKDPMTMAVTSRYVRASMTNLVKVGFPSKTDSPSCEYSRVDFDSDEDFNAFFNSFRAQQGEVVRNACKLIPLEAFQMAGEWLQYQLNMPIDISPTTSKTVQGLCSIFSSSYVQWDAMTFFTESVVSQLIKFVDKEKLPVEQGMELLQAVLNYETRDPLILSCVLTNVSALFPFVHFRLEFLPQVLSKLFSSVTFEVIEENKAPRTRAVKNVRRHACSSIIRMCRDYPQLILPCFEMLYSHVKRLLSNELLFTQMEKCALMEALVLLSNQFKNYKKQKAFLEELMAPVSNRWLSEEMTRVLSDPTLFLAFVGADLKLSDPIFDDPTGINRSRISFCVYTILGVVKRARWPSDLEEAKAGGFVVGYAPNGNPIYRNPCAEQVRKLLHNLLALIRTQNNLFLPENMAKLSETFSKAFDVMEVEKNAVLGLPQPLLELYDCPVYKTVLERMQGFFSALYDNCFHILGNAGPSLQQDFYAIDGLAGQLITSAFINLTNVPDYRLRPMLHILCWFFLNVPLCLRLFMKQLVLSCTPQYYNTLMCPILGPLFAYLLQRLTQKWQVINQRSSLCNSEDEPPEENPMSQEMLEEQLVRLLTREVMDLLSVCCIVKRGSEAAGAKEDELEEEDMMATDASQAPQPATYTLDELTELGKCLLKNEDIGTTFLTIVYSSLSWKDTITCQRMTTQVCWPLLKQVISGSLLPDAVTWFYGAVLRGLQMHGQHEGCNAALIQLAFLTYETLRPRFPELRTVMEQIPQIQMDCLDQFDLKVLNPGQQKTADKKRKDIFKRLISGTVGKPLGQQFKKEVHIKNLPSLFKKTKPEPTLDILDSDSAGLATLFSPDTDDI